MLLNKSNSSEEEKLSLNESTNFSDHLKESNSAPWTNPDFILDDLFSNNNNFKLIDIIKKTCN